MLGFKVGCNVGQFDTEGVSDGRLLGFALVDGESLGTKDGFPDTLGLMDGCKVGQSDVEGRSLGCG